MWLLTILWWRVLRLLTIPPARKPEKLLSAIALGSGFWHRLPTAAPTCQGSALKWLPQAGSPIARTLRQQQASLSLRAFASSFFPWCLVSEHNFYGLLTAASIHSPCYSYRMKLFSLRDEFKGMKVKTLSYRTPCYLLCDLLWSTQMLPQVWGPLCGVCNYLKKWC